MSELLKEYQASVDQSDFDVLATKNKIRTLLKNTGESMKSIEDLEGQKALQLEGELHLISKAVSTGLSPTMSSKSKTEEGAEITEFWPDFRRYGKDEFDYFEKRYYDTNNLFFKTEYGLLIFLNRRLQRNEQKIELVNLLVKLVKEYKLKITDSENWGLYSHAFHTRIDDILSILSGAKELSSEFTSFVQLIENWFLNWPVTERSFFPYSSLLMNSLIDHKRKIQSTIDIGKIIAKLDEAIQNKITDDRRLAISFSEQALRFSSHFERSNKQKYITSLAEMYEAEGDSAVQLDRSVEATKNFEDSLSYFRLLKDADSVDRVSRKFEEHKGKFKMGTVSVEADEEMIARITKHIEGIIEKKEAMLVIANLAGYGVIGSADSYKQMAKTVMGSNSIINFVTLQSMDKYGNTLRIYTEPEEREQYHLIESVNRGHQISIQVLWAILMKSLRVNFFFLSSCTNAS